MNKADDTTSQSAIPRVHSLGLHAIALSFQLEMYFLQNERLRIFFIYLFFKYHVAVKSHVKEKRLIGETKSKTKCAYTPCSVFFPV